MRSRSFHWIRRSLFLSTVAVWALSCLSAVVGQESRRPNTPAKSLMGGTARLDSKLPAYQPPVLQSPTPRSSRQQSSNGGVASPSAGRRSALRQITQGGADSDFDSGPQLEAPQNGRIDFEADRQTSDESLQNDFGAESLDGDSGPFQAIPRIGPEPLEPIRPWDVPEDIGPGEARPGAVNSPVETTPVVRDWLGRRQNSIPPDYWIISSRDCPQSGSPVEADRCTKYYYRGPSGKIEARTAADFHRSLNPDIPVCFMIHGSLIEWEQNVREGHATYEWLKRAAPNTPFQLVLFTWPSERTLLLPPIDFSVLGYRSSYNGLYLARVISRMPASASISLIGHSHGARLTASALHLLGGGEAYGFRLAPRKSELPQIRTVLAAAALDHHWLDPGQRYGKALEGTQSLLNLRNQTDVPLILYPFPMLLGHDSLGRGGFSWVDQYRLGSSFEKVRNVEVTFLLGWGHIWPRFHDHPEIAEAIAPYAFFQKDVPVHSTVMRRWRSRTAEEPQAPVIVKSATGTPPGNRSTLVRGSANLRGSVPKTNSFKKDVEVPLEPGRAVLNPAPAKIYRSSGQRSVRPE